MTVSFYIVSGLIIAGYMVIGGCLLAEPDFPHKLAGIGFLLVAGVILTFAVNHTPGNAIKELDHNECAQYARLSGEWVCVPWEEAG